MKLSTVNTVNVVEYFSDTLQQIVSFPDDEQGNQQAESLFRHCAKDNEFTKEEIEEGLDDGYLAHTQGDYQLFIAHSS